MKKLYLCGPREATGQVINWREQAKKELADKYIVLDPHRRRFMDNEYENANEIVEFDLQDIRESDILLVNYSKASVGTSMEVFYASRDLGKFVIAFSPFSFKDMSPWMVRHCTKILPSLEDSMAYIRRHF